MGRRAEHFSRAQPPEKTSPMPGSILFASIKAWLRRTVRVDMIAAQETPEMYKGTAELEFLRECLMCAQRGRESEISTEAVLRLPQPAEALEAWSDSSHELEVQGTPCTISQSGEAGVRHIEVDGTLFRIIVDGDETALCIDDYGTLLTSDMSEQEQLLELARRLQPVLLLILAHHGIFALHASAVTNDSEGRISAFSGPSGAGKSTIASALTKTTPNARLAADDMLLVTIDDDSRVQVLEHLPFSRDSHVVGTLERLFFLDTKNTPPEADPTLMPCSPIQSQTAIAQQIIGMELLPPKMITALCHAVSGSTAICQLNYPHIEGSLSELMTKVSSLVFASERLTRELPGDDSTVVCIGNGVGRRFFALRFAAAKLATLLESGCTVEDAHKRLEEVFPRGWSLQKTMWLAGLLAAYGIVSFFPNNVTTGATEGLQFLGDFKGDSFHMIMLLLDIGGILAGTSNSPKGGALPDMSANFVTRPPGH